MFSPAVTTERLATFERGFQRRTGKEFRFREIPLDEVDSFNRKLEDAFDVEGRPLRSLTEDEDAFIFHELNRSALDFLYWIPRYFYVMTDRKMLERIQLRGSQRKIVQWLGEEEERQWRAGEKQIKIWGILAKARQLGLSVLAQAINVNLMSLHNGTRALISSDHEDTTYILWDHFEKGFDGLPRWMKPAVENRRFAELIRLVGGAALVGARGNQKTSFGQGKTTDFVHFSEVSTWEFPDVIDSDVIPSFESSLAPLSLFLLESTGAGMDENWFHQQYEQAKAGLGRFKAIFVGWFTWEGKYRLDPTGVRISDATVSMAARVKQEHGVELSKEQVAWYQTMRDQYEAKGKLHDFLQEFPTFEEEAFQAGVPHVFPYTLIQELRANSVTDPEFVFDVNPKTGKLVPTAYNPKATAQVLRVWSLSKPGCTYVVGCDPTTGVGADNAGIFVNLVGTKKWNDEQVAEWYGKLDPFDLARLLWSIGHAYTDSGGLPAKMVIEINPAGGGLQAQQELIRMGYPNIYVNRKWNVAGGGWTQSLGWQTNVSTRPLLTDMGVKWLKDGMWRIHSAPFVQEMWFFMDWAKTKGRRHLQHAPGGHDDLLFAGFLALMGSHEDDTLSLAASRVESLEEARAKKPVKSIKEQILEDDLTVEEAMSAWADRLGL